MSELKESFSEFLRRMMKIKGVSESELARRSKITQPTINRILNDNIGSYRLDTLEALAKGLGLKPSEVISAAVDGDMSKFKNSRFDIYADAFDAHELSESEWQMLETYFNDHVQRWKQFNKERNKINED